MTQFKQVQLKALTVETLPIFRELLGSKDFGGCFCAVWTSYDDTWVQRCQDKTQPNYLITENNCKLGKHIGYLAYSNNELVGWTGSGPKTSFPFLEKKLGSRLSPLNASIWSIGCIALKETARGNGLADSIAQAVIELAKASGAKTIEAYPTLPKDEERIFRGSHNMYRRLGFSISGSENDGSSKILAMTLDLNFEKVSFTRDSFVFRNLKDTDDLEQITQMLHRAYKKWADMGINFMATSQSVEKTKERCAEGHTLIIECQNQIIGTITINLPEMSFGVKWYERPGVRSIHQFAIDPKFQHLGLGKALLNKAEHYAQNLGVKELALDTSNKATELIQFYIKHGYREVDKIKWPHANYESIVLSKALSNSQ